MFHKSQIPGTSRAVQPQSSACAQAERMEARIAELDMAHSTETKRLGTLAATAKKSYLPLKGQGEG
jgi:hypothetical protein